jgi:hypothetical protein
MWTDVKVDRQAGGQTNRGETGRLIGVKTDG